MAKKSGRVSIALAALLEKYGKQIDSAIEKNTVHYTTKQISGETAHCYTIDDGKIFVSVEKTTDAKTKDIKRCVLFIEIKTEKEPVKYASTGDYARTIHDKLFEKYDAITKRRSFPGWLRSLGTKSQKVME
jgi:uncharacterized protein YtpQ (UPF0354 family)